MRQCILGIFLNRFLEILDSVFVVAHILVDKTSLNVDSLIVWQQFLHLGELLQGFVELLSSTVHQTEMEHGGDEGVAVLQ